MAHNKMMKPVQVLSSGTEAEILAGYLRANGVPALVEGTKEYASIVTGGDVGHYRVLVPEDDLEKAGELLRKLDGGRVLGSSQGASTSSEITEVSATTLLKRSVVFGLVGLGILPVLAQIVSIYNMVLLLKSKDNSVSRAVWVPVIVVLNVVGLFVAYRLYVS